LFSEAFPRYPQWRAASHRTINLGGKNTVDVQGGDRLTILSPGGGGYGAPATEDDRSTPDQNAAAAGGLLGSDDDEDGPVALAGSVHEWRLRHEQQ
jgi:5-oxoprolinase (ATP-hydrolysing)